MEDVIFTGTQWARSSRRRSAHWCRLAVGGTDHRPAQFVATKPSTSAPPDQA